MLDFFFFFKCALCLLYYGAFVEDVLQPGTSNGFGWQGLIQLSVCSQIKRNLPDICTGSFFFYQRRFKGNSHLIPALGVTEPNVGFTVLLTATRILSEKSPVLKWNLQVPASVRSFLSPRGTVPCSVCAHYKSVSKQQEG